MERVVLGLSGGVDSSVAAELLKKDYEVHALYLENGAPGGLDAARKAAEAAGLPFHALDIRQELEACVCKPFAEGYLHGQTPNPCVLCNPTVKLRFLCEKADELGAKYIATGHYARKAGGRLCMGRSANDQSYMLCRVTPAQAARLLLPLGELEKEQVRAQAAEHSLPAAAAPDSMEICFVPDNDYGAWLCKRGVGGEPGPIVFEGRVVGTHRGVENFTVGQGSRLRVTVGRKVFVTGIDAQTRTVTLGDDDELWKTQFRVRDCSWLEKPAAEEFSAAVRVRHTRKPPVPCRVKLTDDGGAEITCAELVRAPAPGQSAALYDGEVLLGGGFIVGAKSAPLRRS